jgi:hypothetical protein
VISKKIIKAISEKEMDRKEFLKYSGLAILSVVGFRTVVSLFTEDTVKKTVIVEKHTESSARSFGGGKYGV